MSSLAEYGRIKRLIKCQNVKCQKLRGWLLTTWYYSPTVDNLLQIGIRKLMEKMVRMRINQIGFIWTYKPEELFLLHTSDSVLNSFTWLKPHTVEYISCIGWWVLIRKLCGVSAHLKDGTENISKCINITFHYRVKPHSMKRIETIPVACRFVGNPLEFLSHLVYKTFQSQATIIKDTPGHLFGLCLVQKMDYVCTLCKCTENALASWLPLPNQVFNTMWLTIVWHHCIIKIQ